MIFFAAFRESTRVFIVWRRRRHGSSSDGEMLLLTLGTYVLLLGKVWLGKVWLGKVWLGKVWLGKVWLGKVWLGKVWLGKVWLGKVWLGKVWLGKVWSGRCNWFTMVDCANVYKGRDL